MSTTHRSQRPHRQCARQRSRLFRSPRWDDGSPAGEPVAATHETAAPALAAYPFPPAACVAAAPRYLSDPLPGTPLLQSRPPRSGAASAPAWKQTRKTPRATVRPHPLPDDPDRRSKPAPAPTRRHKPDRWHLPSCKFAAAARMSSGAPARPAPPSPLHPATRTAEHVLTLRDCKPSKPSPCEVSSLKFGLATP